MSDFQKQITNLAQDILREDDDSRDWIMASKILAKEVLRLYALNDLREKIFKNTLLELGSLK
jgi:hypothetical protein